MARRPVLPFVRENSWIAHRPLLVLSAVFIAGVAVAGAAATHVALTLILLALPAARIVWEVARGRTGLDVVAAVVFVAGMLAGIEASLPPRLDDIAHLADGRHAIAGRVAAVLDGRRLVLDVDAVRDAPRIRAGRLELRLRSRGQRPEPTRVYAARPGAFAVGDHVVAEGSYFGDANDPRARGRGGAGRARLGVSGTMFADAVGRVADRAATPPTVARLAYDARNALDAANHRHLEPVLADTLSGLVLGVDVADPALRQAFRDAGLMHALVASGAQLGIAAGLIHLALRRANRWLRAGVTLAGVWAFATLAGFEPSMARAFAMAGVGLTAAALRRDGDAGTTLALSAAILVASQPRLLDDIGFQLSFAATAGLIFLSPPVANWIDARIPWLAATPEPRAEARGAREGGRRFLRDAIAATLGANAAVLPILVWNFQQVQTLSLISNVLALPAVSAIVPLGFAASVAGVVAPPLAGLLYIPAGWICAYLIALARGVATVPIAVLPVPGWSIFVMGGGAVWLWARRARAADLAFGPVVVTPARLAEIARATPRARWALAAGAVVVLILWIQIALDAARPSLLTLTMIDVGQGDSLLLESPGGRAVLIDAGPDPERLARWLQARGRRHLDLVLLSHPHADHVTGLTTILERFSVGAVLDPGYPHATPAYRDFLRAVENRRVPYRKGSRAASFETPDGMRAHLLWPPSRFVAGESPPNENSSVVRVTYGGQAMLLTGDIETVAEGALVAAGEDLTAQTLKIPHQGSRTSSSEAFLHAVRPRIGLLSVGAGNDYGHPHREVVARYRRLGIRVYRTDLDGTIAVKTDGVRLWVDTAKARALTDGR